MFSHLRIAILAFMVMPFAPSLAVGLPMQSRTFAAPRLTFVQHSPEYCRDGCQKQYQFCAQGMNQGFNEGSLDQQLLQLGLARCERNYQRCVKDCS